MRKNPYHPTVERSTAHTVNGLTLATVETKTFTFTLKQLKHAVTADKLFAFPVPREYALDVFCGLVRKHRYEIMGNYDPYKIITNGYGQLKCIEAYHGDKLDATFIFRKLEQLTL